MTTIRLIEDVFRDGFTMTDLDWTEWRERGRVNVERHVLWAPFGDDEDSAGLLLRFPPGAHGDFHEHLGFEMMLVLDGRLDHSNGSSFNVGTLIVESPGTRHMMSSETGCTVLAIRTRPAVARKPNPGEIQQHANAAPAVVPSAP